MNRDELESFLDRNNYPPEYYKLIELNLLQFKPWDILYDERLQLQYEGLKERYPKRNVIPFAVRLDCDDVACINLKDKKVIIIHDYASEGWERRSVYNTFWDWFRQAVEDMIEFAKDDIEYEQKNK